MEYFWDTAYTIPADQGFPLFGAGHLMWLFLIIIICLVLGQYYARWREEKRQRCRRVLAVLLLLDEAFKLIVTTALGRFQPDFLPLHLCSINIFVILADALQPREALREELYAVCLPGASFALLFPGWAYLPIGNALCIHSFTAHILLFLYPYLLLRGGFRPQFRRFLRVLPFCLPAVGLAYLFNRIFGTNFMFLQYAGEGNPLSLFESWLGRPGYLVGIPILAELCWLCLYGVPALIQRRKRH